MYRTYYALPDDLANKNVTKYRRPEPDGIMSADKFEHGVFSSEV